MAPRKVVPVVLAVVGLLVLFLLAGSLLKPRPAPGTPPAAPAPPSEPRDPAAPRPPETPQPAPDAEPAEGEEIPVEDRWWERHITAVTVRVVRAEDRGPVPGATVEWTMEGEPDRSARTGEDGTARFEGFPERPFRVAARAPGRVRDRAEVAQTDVGGRETRDADGALLLTLERGVAIEGVVLSARDRSPVAGATVTALPGGSLGGDFEVTDRDESLGAVRTGPGGRFEAAPVPPGRIASLLVEHPDFREADRTLRPAAEPPHGGPLEFLLEEAASVRGTVLGPDGRPAAGAEVRAVPRTPADPGEEEDDGLIRYPDGNRRGDPLNRDAGGRATAGADGAYAVRGLAPGVLHRVHAFRGEEERSPLVEVTTPAAGLAGTADLRLEPLTRVLVRVEGPDGEGIAKAHVTLAPAAGPWPEDRESEAHEGEFVFTQVLPGEYVVAVRCQDLEDGRAPVRVGRGWERVTVRLGAGVAIEGRIVDDTGAGVPGKDVLAYRLAGDGSDRDALDESEHYRQAKADGEGRFRFGGLRPGPHVLSLYGVDEEPVAAAAPASGVLLRHARPTAAVARLVFPEGAAVPARVGARVTSWHGERGMTSGGNESAFDGKVLRVWQFPAGRHEVEVRIPGFARAVRSFEGRPGQTVDLGEIRLSRGVAVRGRVLDPLGRPVPGATVRPEWSFEKPAVADPGGRFLLEHMPEGELRLEIRAGGWPGTEVTVQAAADLPEIPIPLARGGTVRGVIRRADGRPLRGTVCFRGPGMGDRDPHPEAFADEDGRFEACLLPGVYAARVHSREGESPPRDVEVVAGAEARLEFTVAEPPATPSGGK